MKPRETKDERIDVEGIASTVSRAAQAIAGPMPPYWLIQALGRKASFVDGYRQSDESAPDREPMRKRLTQVAAAAGTLNRELAIHETRVFIDHAGKRPVLPIFESEMATLLTLLVDIERAARLAANAIPGGQGNHPANPKRAGSERKFINSRTLTAFIIDAAWMQFHGTRPGVNNSNASDACSALWEAAGGSDPQGTGWRVWFEKARLLPTEPSFKSLCDDIWGSFSAAPTIYAE